MNRIFLLLVLLTSCGADRVSESGGGSANNDQAQSTYLDLSDLDGLPVDEFVRAIVPRLANAPGTRSRADLAAALEQKWKIHCEQTCRIERK